MVGSTGVISDWSIAKNPAPAASTVKVSRRELRREVTATRDNSLITYGMEACGPSSVTGSFVGVRAIGVARRRSGGSRGKLTGGRPPGFRRGASTKLAEGCLRMQPG
ncbi:hypothetical protein Misp05_34340 [Micromonospora sp. NBRC 107095]|nr:hypothetical protein Misp05_34340 [Micromonospora sp. NBRC 107095]